MEIPTTLAVPSVVDDSTSATVSASSWLGLMKRVGFSSEKAGAVEVASSVNGQIMPPVMGAAAFLMVEYVGISYLEVIKHAILPALISYMALVYIVHLEACKMNLKGMVKPVTRTFAQKLLSFVLTILFLITVGKM